MSDKVVVLVLEDTEHMQKYLSRQLEKRGYEAVIASSLQEGREILNSRVIDAGVIDIQLKEGELDNADGMIFLDDLQKYFSQDKTHVVMLSGHADKEKVKDALTRPLQIVKNFFFKEELDEKELLAEVARCVRTSQSMREESLQKKIRPYLPKHLLDSLSLDNIISSLGFHEADLSTNKSLNQCLENLLFDMLPLSHTEKTLTKLTAGNWGNSVNFVCWSRKKYLALEISIGKAGVKENLSIQIATKNSENFNIEGDIETTLFDAMLFSLPDLTFREFQEINEK